MVRVRNYPSGKKVYQADGINEKGERERVGFPTMELAKRFEDRVLHKDLPNLSIGRLFPRWFDELYRGTKNEETAKYLTATLVREFKPETRITDLTRTVIKETQARWQNEPQYVQNRKTPVKLSTQTINNRINILTRYLQHAEDEEIAEGYEVPNLKGVRKGNRLSRRYLFFTGQQERALWAAFETDFTRHLATFLIDTGCRYGEAAKLHIRKDWMHNERRVVFWDTKTGGDRTVSLTGRAYEALTWAKKQGGDHPWVSSSYDSFLAEWHRSVARVMKAQPDLELTQKHVPYICRHTCATRLAKAKMPELKIAEWMGHSSLETTRRYTHYVGGDMDEMANVLEQFAA